MKDKYISSMKDKYIRQASFISDMGDDFKKVLGHKIAWKSDVISFQVSRIVNIIECLTGCTLLIMERVTGCTLVYGPRGLRKVHARTGLPRKVMCEVH